MHEKVMHEIQIKQNKVNKLKAKWLKNNIILPNTMDIVEQKETYVFTSLFIVIRRIESLETI